MIWKVALVVAVISALAFFSKKRRQHKNVSPKLRVIKPQLGPTLSPEIEECEQRIV